jgi:hypothetical protein
MTAGRDFPPVTLLQKATLENLQHGGRELTEEYRLKAAMQVVPLILLASDPLLTPFLRVEN